MTSALRLATTARRLVAWLLLAMLPTGCAATLVAPPPPERPRPVALLDHGRHSTLLLTTAEGGRVRWAYADWDWYVERDHGVGAALRALFANSRAALGRQPLPPASAVTSLAQQVGVFIERTIWMQAEAGDVDALLAKLERIFEASPQAPRFSDEVNLALVPHPQPYTFGRNSNHMVAEWLRELGVEVRGDPALGRWRLAEKQGVLTQPYAARR